MPDIAGTSLAEPMNYRAYREMTLPGRPGVGGGAHPSPVREPHPTIVRRLATVRLMEPSSG